MSKADTAVLLIGYGGPEKKEDIMPFLNEVARGRPIPKDRLEEVAHHYELIGGRSPLNEFTYKQAKKLQNFLNLRGYCTPVYIGMRNWHPFFSEAVSEMKRDGIKNVVGFILAAHQSYVSWERYIEEVQEACENEGAEFNFRYSEPLFDHPLFIENCADNVRECLDEITGKEREDTKVIFTAHSIPVEMAQASPYVRQLEETCRGVAESLDHPNWMLAYQSRSGSPREPWLEPDICDVIEALGSQGTKRVVVQPLGFLCDHVEVMFDIGIEAKEAAEKAGVELYRARTVNDDDKFIKAMEDLVLRQLPF